MTCEVDVWTIPLDAAQLTLNVLSPDEEARAARFHFEQDRLRWSAARNALRRVLAQYLPVNAADLAFRTGPHGKPAVDGLEFNISHSHGWAMIAVSRTAAVGVDLEAIRERVDIARLLARLGETNLPESREALFQRWTEREARTKALGSPLMQQPPEHIRAVPVTAPEGFAASVAADGANPLPRHLSLDHCGSL